MLLVGGDERGDRRGLRERRLLDAVGERGDLLRVTGVVGPGEVDDTAHVVALDQLGGRTDTDLLEVGVDVGLVGCGRGVAVHPHHEELADLLLEGHAVDDPPELPVVVPVLLGMGGGAHPGDGGRCRGRGHREESASGGGGGAVVH